MLPRLPIAARTSRKRRRARKLDAAQRDNVLALVHAHGWNATSFQTLESGYQYFFYDEDACVAYVDTGSAWVAAGGPLAAQARHGEVARAFVQAAREQGRRACFFATEQVPPPHGLRGFRRLLIGEQPSWDPTRWEALAAGTRSLKYQLTRARNKGVTVRMLSPEEFASVRMRRTLSGVVARWLETRRMPEMGFLVRVEPLDLPEHRTCFVAEWRGEVVAFAGVVPVPARNGYFIEDLLRLRHAPNGTTELLVDASMRWAAERGSRWVTLGMVPLAGSVAPWLSLARAGTVFLYDFRGLRAYKSKLLPQEWSPVYLSYPRTQSAARSLLDGLTAFTEHGLLDFGVRTLGRMLRDR